LIRHLQKLRSLGKALVQLLELDHARFQLGTLATQRLRPLRALPERWILERAHHLHQALTLGFDAKDTPQGATSPSQVFDTMK
jgi:hypothetical protein